MKKVLFATTGAAKTASLVAAAKAKAFASMFTDTAKVRNAMEYAAGRLVNSLSSFAKRAVLLAILIAVAEFELVSPELIETIYRTVFV